jgi:hypothetical protein
MSHFLYVVKKLYMKIPQSSLVKKKFKYGHAIWIGTSLDENMLNILNYDNVS